MNTKVRTVDEEIPPNPSTRCQASTRRQASTSPPASIRPSARPASIRVSTRRQASMAHRQASMARRQASMARRQASMARRQASMAHRVSIRRRVSTHPIAESAIGAKVARPRNGIMIRRKRRRGDKLYVVLERGLYRKKNIIMDLC